MNITRRTVLKTLAAATLAPTIELRQHIDRERLLRAFCDDAPYRYDLDQPWGIGSLTYASDARHICRAEIANRVENGERRLPKNVINLWDRYWHHDGLVPFELPSPDTLTLGAGHDCAVCPYCDDRRIFLGDKYPEFDDCGRALAGPDYDVDTNTVRDKGCPACRGKTWDGSWQINIGGVLLNYSRLKPIAALPNVRVAATKATPIDIKGERKHCHPNVLLFAADGFDGMAMGMTS